MASKNYLTLEQMIRQFAIIRKANARYCQKELAAYRFSPCELDILTVLSNNSTITSSLELSVYLGVSKSLIARSVESLVNREMVAVHEDVKDHRIQRLTLCEPANQVLTALKHGKEKLGHRLFKDISKAELDQVTFVMNKFQRNIESLLKEDDFYENC